MKGAASPDDLRRVVGENMGRFRLCYTARLAKSPTLHGDLSVALTIDPSGAVTNAKDGGSTLGDPELVACVVKQFTRLRVASFAPPSAAASVPLQFLGDQ